MTNEVLPIKGKPSLPCVVADGTTAGQVVPVGPDGLMAVTVTPQITQAMLDTGTAPQGFNATEAACQLLGCCGVLNLPLVNAIAIYKAVYRVIADGTYSATAAGGVKIGYSLGALGAAGNVDVVLIG